MTDTEIIKLLKGTSLDRKGLSHRLLIATKEEEKELDDILDHLLFQGIVGVRANSYYLLAEQNIQLVKVTLKKRNFVVLEIIPSHEEIKISGEEADGLLVGDYLYVKKVQGLYHGIDYLKPIDTFRGKYSLDESGKETVLLDYLNECGKSIVITKKDEGVNPCQGDLVEAKILGYSGQVFKVKVTKVLVSAKDVGSDVRMIIVENDAPIDFPQKVLDEANSIPQELKAEDYKDRSDFRMDTVVTIDGNDSKDFDDAVSIRRVNNGYEVMVHIADVTHYVRPSSALDTEAVSRGTSIYVADRVVPMLPETLSNGICSLNPNVDRLTLTVIMQLDNMGNVFSSNVVRSVICSHGRLTYEKVNDFFKTGETEYSDGIKETLTLLHECSAKIRRRRSLQGALKLSSTKLKFTLDENGNPTEVKKQEQGEAEMMIEDLMIIANCEVSKLLKKHNIPVLYRVHEFPPLDKLASFKDFIKKVSPKSMSLFPRDKDISGARLNSFLDTIQDENLRSVISYMMLRAMSKARYSPEELGHFGLAEPYYCHFTSPIRRYPDDIIHRLVKDYLIDKKPYNPISLNNYLEKMGDVTSICEARSTDIERQVDDLESAKYMMNHIGETFKGKVTGFVKRGMFVETEIGIEGFLAFHCMHGDVFHYDERAYAAIGKHHPELSFGITTPIEVTVLSSNPDTQEINFATPVFYKIYAKGLSDEAREDLAMNGIHVSDEEEDFRPMTRKFGDKFPRGRYDDRRREEYKDHDVRMPKDDSMPWEKDEDTGSSESEEEQEVIGTGYTGKKKAAPKKDDRKFGGKKGGFRKGGKFDKKKPDFSDHQGYANYVRENRRPEGDGFDSKFDRKPRFNDGERDHRGFDRKPRYDSKRSEGGFSRREDGYSRKPRYGSSDRNSEHRGGFDRSRDGRPSYPRKPYHKDSRDSGDEKDSRGFRSTYRSRGGDERRGRDSDSFKKRNDGFRKSPSRSGGFRKGPRRGSSDSYRSHDRFDRKPRVKKDS